MTTRQRRFIGAVFAAVLLATAVLIRVHRASRASSEFIAAPSDAEFGQLGKNLGRTAQSDQVVPAPAEVPKRIRLAIGSLSYTEPREGELADLVMVKLSQSEDIDLVERRSLQKVLDELHLTLSGFVRAKDAVQVGKLLKANWFLLASPLRLNGTNLLVLRIVDGATGVLRAAGTVDADGKVENAASSIASFVRQAHAAALEAKPQVFLGLGGFADVGPNNRLAEFPKELRAYLTAAYRGTGVTLVEREFVESLLNEMTLDLAGLTEVSTPMRMQPAFWLVEGTYQSYETSTKEIEVILAVDRILGDSSETKIRDAAGEPVYQKIKQSIDTAMREQTHVHPYSRSSEADWQIETGWRLLGVSRDLLAKGLMVDDGFNVDPNNIPRYKRNAEEALHAFESALLLESTNYKAMLGLATCLRKTYMDRLPEARDYYRQILDAGQSTHLFNEARMGLQTTWLSWRDSESEKAAWYANAESRARDPSAAAFFHEQAQKTAASVGAAGNGPQKSEMAKQLLFTTINDYISGRLGARDWGMLRYMQDFKGEDAQQVDQRLVSVLAEVKTKFPDVYPFVLAAAVANEPQSNPALISEFEASMTNHIDELKKRRFVVPYLDVLEGVVSWSIKHTNYDLAIQVLKAKLKAESPTGDLAGKLRAKNSDQMTRNDDVMNLAYAYEGMQNWRSALDIFETFSNRPVLMGNQGFYGKGLTLVFPNRHCDNCRTNMGLPPIRDPRQFSLTDDRGLSFRQYPKFTTDADGLWVGAEGRLFRFNYNLTTNWVLDLPVNPGAPVLAICASSSTVWIGTSENGLVAVDRNTKTIRHWTEEDGLLMNTISAMAVDKNTLWIGYGHKTWTAWAVSGDIGKGGFGLMNLRNGQIESFTRSIISSQEKAPQTPIRSLSLHGEGEVWLTAAPSSAVFRYNIEHRSLETVPKVDHVISVAACPDLAAVIGDSPKSSFGLKVLDQQSGQWRSVLDTNSGPIGMPNIAAILNGEVWIGGIGYIARIDTASNQVKNFLFLNSPDGVDDLKTGNGEIWGQRGWTIFHAAIPE